MIEEVIYRSSQNHGIWSKLSAQQQIGRY